MASKKKKRNAKTAQKVDTSVPKERNVIHLQMILAGKSKGQKMGDRRTKRNRTRGAKNRKAIREQW